MRGSTLSVLVALLAIPSVGCGPNEATDDDLPGSPDGGSEEDPDPPCARETRLDQRLTAESTLPGENFGLYVAMDSGTLVFGAPQVSHDLENQGAAFVFERSGSSYLEGQALLPSDPAEGAFFATAVAIEGHTLIVGAYQSTPGDTQSAGSVYVFERQNGFWRETQKLVSSQPTVGGSFGSSVALSAGWLVVGASGERAAYMYRRESGGFVATQRLSQEALFFGQRAATDGTLLVVTAPGDSEAASFAGAAFVYRLQAEGGPWELEGKVFADAPAAGDGFGSTLALGAEVAVIGATLHDHDGVTGAGAAYTFLRSGDGLEFHSKLGSPAPQPDGRFGSSVALVEDEVLVGAILEDGAEADAAGAVYLFGLEGNVFEERERITDPEGGSHHRFGFAMASEGEEFVVGAPLSGPGIGLRYARSCSTAP